MATKSHSLQEKLLTDNLAIWASFANSIQDIANQFAVNVNALQDQINEINNRLLSIENYIENLESSARPYVNVSAPSISIASLYGKTYTAEIGVYSNKRVVITCNDYLANLYIKTSEQSEWLELTPSAIDGSLAIIENATKGAYIYFKSEYCRPKTLKFNVITNSDGIDVSTSFVLNAHLALAQVTTEVPTVVNKTTLAAYKSTAKSFVNSTSSSSLTSNLTSTQKLATSVASSAGIASSVLQQSNK